MYRVWDNFSYKAYCLLCRYHTIQMLYNGVTVAPHPSALCIWFFWFHLHLRGIRLSAPNGRLPQNDLLQSQRVWKNKFLLYFLQTYLTLNRKSSAYSNCLWKKWGFLIWNSTIGSEQEKEFEFHRWIHLLYLFTDGTYIIHLSFGDPPLFQLYIFICENPEVKMFHFSSESLIFHEKKSAEELSVRIRRTKYDKKITRHNPLFEIPWRLYLWITYRS